MTTIEKYQHLGIHPLDEHNLTLLNNTHPADYQNPTPAPLYNLVVIGGGSAGLIAAAGASGLGAKVALVERHLMGGDCLNIGCVPSKTIIRSAKVLNEIARAPRYGVQVSEVTVDFGRVMERVRAVRAGLSPVDSVQRYSQQLGVEVFLGQAQFTGADTIAVNGQTLRFKKAVIATGSRPFAPPIEGLKEAGYLTNETLFNLTEQPRRLGVIGAGPIGSELAQTFRRLGSEVVVFDQLPQVLGREDAEAAALIEKTFRHEGIRIELEAAVKRVRVTQGGKVIEFERGGKRDEVEVDEILLAVGRIPNVESLELEKAGVAYDRKGLKVDDTLRTDNPNIYGAGDVAFKYQFTHTADATARLVLQNALFPTPKRNVSDLVIPWTTYTSPEVAQVGAYEKELKDKGIAYDVYRVPLDEVDRSVADGETEGFVKILTPKGKDKILGATIVAPHAGEMIAEVTLAMTQGIGLGKIAQVIHAYPTATGAVKRAADLYNRTRLTPLVARIFKWWFKRGISGS
jgi:pyruvate/2-oxoglutarate dehydrogenase complex dihydrolipoamide dehydrogenase (E3) component